MSANFLPSEDLEFLDKNYVWKKTDIEDDKRGLIIKNYSLPAGYKPTKSDLMILIPTNYPGSAIDMFYFDPDISRIDGKGIAALDKENHFGRTWQRWSRHYEWCPDSDNVAKHICFVGNLLTAELKNQ